MDRRQGEREGGGIGGRRGGCEKEGIGRGGRGKVKQKENRKRRKKIRRCNMKD